MPRILVFIPAYRCERQIVRVLQQFDDEVQEHIDTVMVVDNRSPDDTLKCAIEIGEQRLRKCHFVAWRNDDNYGLGGSHKAAFRYAIDQSFDYLVVLHGDDQADIRDLLPYLKAGDYRNLDCFLGARFMKGSRIRGYSAFRTFGNIVYNQLFSMVTLRRIYDLGSGLNMYRLKNYREFYYRMFPDDLTFNYVMLLASYNRRQEVAYFPISWREEDQASNVKLVRQSLRVLRFLTLYFLKRSSFLTDEMRLKFFDAYSGTIVNQTSPE